MAASVGQGGKRRAGSRWNVCAGNREPTLPQQRSHQGGWLACAPAGRARQGAGGERVARVSLDSVQAWPFKTMVGGTCAPQPIWPQCVSPAHGHPPALPPLWSQEGSQAVQQPWPAAMALAAHQPMRSSWMPCRGARHTSAKLGWLLQPLMSRAKRPGLAGAPGCVRAGVRALPDGRCPGSLPLPQMAQGEGRWRGLQGHSGQCRAARRQPGQLAVEGRAGKVELSRPGKGGPEQGRVRGGGRQPKAREGSNC